MPGPFKIVRVAAELSDAVGRRVNHADIPDRLIGKKIIKQTTAQGLNLYADIRAGLGLLFFLNRVNTLRNGGAVVRLNTV